MHANGHTWWNWCKHATPDCSQGLISTCHSSWSIVNVFSDRGNRCTQRKPTQTWGEHTNSSQNGLGIEHGTFYLWSMSANHCTTAPPYLTILVPFSVGHETFQSFSPKYVVDASRGSPKTVQHVQPCPVLFCTWAVCYGTAYRREGPGSLPHLPSLLLYSIIISLTPERA